MTRKLWLVPAVALVTFIGMMLCAVLIAVIAPAIACRAAWIALCHD